MNASSVDFDRCEVLHLRRDFVEHAWMPAIGGHWVPLPWAETADAVSVLMWLEGRTSGPVKIRVEQ